MRGSSFACWQAARNIEDVVDERDELPEIAAEEVNAMKQAQKMVITKYALTRGLFVKELQSDGEYARDPQNFFFGRIGRDCFHTAVEAERYAKAKARLKIAALKRQIAQLEKLAAEPKWYTGKA